VVRGSQGAERGFDTRAAVRSPAPGWLAGACLIATFSTTPVVAQQFDYDALGDEAIALLRDYVRVNTVNPPGNESRGVEFFARLLTAENIHFEVAESAPGRGNIWARIEGGDEPALILLHHMDVVPADEAHWTTDPLGAEIRDGFMYGRGTQDTKTLGIEHFLTFVALHRAGVRLNRDVIFMATADEEAGGFFGVGWLVEHRPHLFDGVGMLLNEGGDAVREAGGPVFEVEVTQKVPYWFELTAVDRPGHGSRPYPTSAVTRLIAALDRLHEHTWTPRVVPAVDTYFKGLAPRAGDYWGPRLADMAATIEHPDELARLQEEHPSLAALTRTTCSITMLEGSDKINVVPPQASAQLDCRLLPDQDPTAFLRELTGALGDDAISIRRILGFTPAISTTDTDLFRAIQRAIQRHYPGAPVIPAVSTGFTDSHFTRDLGIVSYGFNPAIEPAGDGVRTHGNDERVLVEQVKLGTRIMLELVADVTGVRR